MGKHHPNTSSEAVKRQRKIRTIDEQLTRLSRSQRLNPNEAMRTAIDDLLDQRAELGCTLGEMINPEDRALLSEWGEADTGTAA